MLEVLRLSETHGQSCIGLLESCLRHVRGNRSIRYACTGIAFGFERDRHVSTHMLKHVLILSMHDHAQAIKKASRHIVQYLRSFHACTHIIFWSTWSILSNTTIGICADMLGVLRLPETHGQSCIGLLEICLKHVSGKSEHPLCMHRHSIWISER